LSQDWHREARALARLAEHVVSEEELAERLQEGRPLRVKLGVDPTARDITLGWAVPLRKLRTFQNHGHTAVLIVGDFTARIGDPSGKSETRPQLSREQVKANAEACVVQLLDILSEEHLEVRYNSEWLESMDLGGILELTSNITVAQMLEREDFSTRHDAHKPISLIEFMYPLLQGYDSVAIGADVELGGTDQLFNLLVARHLQRAYGQRPQIAMTMPLLVGLDGTNKMSQSLGNYVAIRERPVEMFGKLMSVPDDLVSDYASLGTNLDDAAVEEIAGGAGRGGPGAGEAKRAMARSIVELYHGPDEARAAEERFDLQFKQHGAPPDIPEAPLPPDAVRNGVVLLPIALAALGLAASRGEARRLIGQRGVRLNGKVIEAEELPAADVEGSVVQVGKRRFVRIAGGPREGLT
jgi:tyrosyl-tRNA synthetase